MNRIGDFAFLLGMMLLFISTGTLKYFGESGATPT
jgi:NADH:ubiquinone oxidoreductase subunit 5 (subunit L)/multisubunit Na+/H+ antiporter MnhA subunit